MKEEIKEKAWPSVFEEQYTPEAVIKKIESNNLPISPDVVEYWFSGGNLPILTRNLPKFWNIKRIREFEGQAAEILLKKLLEDKKTIVLLEEEQWVKKIQDYVNKNINQLAINRTNLNKINYIQLDMIAFPFKQSRFKDSFIEIECKSMVTSKKFNGPWLTYSEREYIENNKSTVSILVVRFLFTPNLLRVRYSKPRGGIINYNYLS